MPANPALRLTVLASHVARLHPDDPLPEDTRRALRDALDAVRPGLSGAAAAGVDVLTADEDARAGEALRVLADVNRVLR